MANQAKGQSVAQLIERFRNEKPTNARNRWTFTSSCVLSHPSLLGMWISGSTTQSNVAKSSRDPLNERYGCRKPLASALWWQEQEAEALPQQAKPGKPYYTVKTSPKDDTNGAETRTVTALRRLARIHPPLMQVRLHTACPCPVAHSAVLLKGTNAKRCQRDSESPAATQALLHMKTGPLGNVSPESIALVESAMATAQQIMREPPRIASPPPAQPSVQIKAYQGCENPSCSGSSVSLSPHLSPEPAHCEERTEVRVSGNGAFPDRRGRSQAPHARSMPDRHSRLDDRGAALSCALRGMGVRQGHLVY